MIYGSHERISALTCWVEPVVIFEMNSHEIRIGNTTLRILGILGLLN